MNVSLNDETENCFLSSRNPRLKQSQGRNKLPVIELQADNT